MALSYDQSITNAAGEPVIALQTENAEAEHENTRLKRENAQAQIDIGHLRTETNIV